MAEAEALVNRHQEINRQVLVRLNHRTALDKFEVDGEFIFKKLQAATEENERLKKHIQGGAPLGCVTASPNSDAKKGLEASISKLKPAVLKLRGEKTRLEGELLEAQKSAVPPRTLLFVRNLEETAHADVAGLREKLGLGTDRCDFCVLCLGQMHESQRLLQVERATIVREQQALVALGQAEKEKYEARTKAIEGEIQQLTAAGHREKGKLERRIGELVTRVKELEVRAK